MKTKLNLQNIEDTLIQFAKQAIRIIQKESLQLIATDKVGYDGKLTDVATNGDLRAQEFYLKQIQKHFPKFGVIAEENSLTIPSKTIGFTAYFTIDPVDGTKAYARNQSHGVGTMIALIIDNIVVLTVIGDTNSGDIYSYNTQGNAKRTRFGKFPVPLTANTENLKKRYISIRPNPFEIPSALQSMIAGPEKLFKSFEVESGSIGIFFARLWKGEVGALLLEPNFATPWDESPVVGLSMNMGFCFYYFNGNQFIPHTPIFNSEIKHTHYYQLILHKSHTHEIENWNKKYEHTK
jgi:fructose-1,6-bisphosphatase/inositol monophosphatase family enzyme